MRKNNMEKNTGLYKIGEIEFKDINVNIYHDRYISGEILSWRRRNTKGYDGPMFLDKTTNKVSYPKDTTVPELSTHDLEMIPNFIITREKELTDEYRDETLKNLEKEFSERNK